MNRTAIVLLSGGLDSTTVLAKAIEQGYDCYALSFDYGQKNKFELATAKKIATKFRAKAHKIVHLDMQAFGGSSLTTNAEVEQNRSLKEIGTSIPSTYVPMRNTIFISFALAWAEVISAQNVFIGVNAIDTSGYPDCSPQYISCFQELANLGSRLGTTGSKITIHAPLQELNKQQIIALGISLGVDYSETNTCYDPKQNGAPCQSCDACILRKRGFEASEIEDPLDSKWSI